MRSRSTTGPLRPAPIRFALPGLVLGLGAALTPSRAQTCSLELVSVNTTGGVGNGDSNFVELSADGRWVVFLSHATNLVAGDIANGTPDVYVRDRVLGTTENVSSVPIGTGGTGILTTVSISADGNLVCFTSPSNALVAGDTNGQRDVFVRDRLFAVTTRVSLGETGNQGNGRSLGIICDDGSKVLFESDSNNLVAGDTNGLQDVFVRDLVAGTTVRVNLDSVGNQTVGGSSSIGAISSDGRYVLFNSSATNLFGAWVRDLVTGTNERIDVSNYTEIPGSSAGSGKDISGDGRFVVFQSEATNLVLNDTNMRRDIFLRDRLLHETRRVSVSSTGVQANQVSSEPRISTDGRTIVFGSSATNLVAVDVNGFRDMFVYDVATHETRMVTYAHDGLQITADAPNAPAIDQTGSTVAFYSNADGIVPQHTGGTGIHDAYVLSCNLSRLGTFCDGTALNCPCGNNGIVGHGCANSVNPSGAQIVASGSPAADDVVLTASGMPNVATCIFLQGDVDGSINTPWGGIVFGDGNRCADGNLKRLATRVASGGISSYPDVGDPTLSARSAALGDPLAPGAVRIYQVYYRNASATFCPEPIGATFNVTNAVVAVW